MIRAPWVSHFGFTATPFSKTIPASQLCERPSLQEAVARIRFTVAETQLGVLTGEVGVGKTVAVRAAVSQLDPAAHHVIYVPNPAFGTRGLYVTIVRSLGAMPRFHKAELIAQAQSLLAAEEQERRRRVVLIVDLCRARNYADAPIERTETAPAGGPLVAGSRAPIGIVTALRGRRALRPTACSDQVAPTPA